MELYHNDMSVCAQKVRLVLAEKQLAPTLHPLDLRAGDAHTPAYLALNPNGVVPTLVDHGRPIVESSVICEYLEDAYPAVRVTPADPVDRARMRWWTMKPDAGLNRACGKTSFAIAFRHQAPQRQIAAITDDDRRQELQQLVSMGLDTPGVTPFLRGFAAIVPAIDDALDGGDWLAGPGWSLADAAMLPYVVRLDMLQLGFLWDRRPRLAAWLDRCQARPCYAAMRDFIPPPYAATMRAHGMDEQARVRAMLA